MRRPYLCLFASVSASAAASAATRELCQSVSQKEPNRTEQNRPGWTKTRPEVLSSTWACNFSNSHPRNPRIEYTFSGEILAAGASRNWLGSYEPLNVGSLHPQSKPWSCNFNFLTWLPRIDCQPIAIHMAIGSWTWLTWLTGWASCSMQLHLKLSWLVCQVGAFSVATNKIRASIWKAKIEK